METCAVNLSKDQKIKWKLVFKKKTVVTSVLFGFSYINLRKGKIKEQRDN